MRIGELENLILEAKRKNNNLANDFLSLEKEYNGLKNKLADTNTNLNDNLKRLESANSEIDKVTFFLPILNSKNLSDSRQESRVFT